MASFAEFISEPKDGGAILVESLVTEDSSLTFKLRLKPETCLEEAGFFKQWFSFSTMNMPCGTNSKIIFEILDAGSSTYSDWNGYKACMSVNSGEWIRIANTEFVDGVLRWTLKENTFQTADFAYFPTYSLERQLELVAFSRDNGAHHFVLGQSVDGRDIHALRFSRTTECARRKPVVWVQCRQHPGEVAASWFCEGFIKRLLAQGDEVVAQLLDSADVIVVPNINPDGGIRGHLRTNATGANLNRCWGGFHSLTARGQSTPPAPETKAVMDGMRAVGGPDLLFDIHQDEEKAYSFISKTPLGVPSCTPALRALHFRFKERLATQDSNFETPGNIECAGYPEPAAGTANLNICSASVAEAFPGCLAMTLEMPYKGNPNAGEAAALGWSIEDCHRLGRAAVAAIADTVPELVIRHSE